ncbi:MAG: hypothetical protein CV088_08335 [Nitrospira sp. LK70]|nr:hypothetical protein [Nitrospira sp. LK70]
MPARQQPTLRPSKRYGAAELFGHSLVGIDPKELQRLSSADNRAIPCPFKPDHASCHKKGGVCSLTLYERGTDGTVSISQPPVTTCPSRFFEGNAVFKWVHQTLQGPSEVSIVNEATFLIVSCVSCPN